MVRTLLGLLVCVMAYFPSDAAPPQARSRLPEANVSDRPTVEAVPIPYVAPTSPQRTSRPGEEVTIEGRLFFNDRRETGLFGVRRDRDGNPTTECDPQGLRDEKKDGSVDLCWLNWAGAQHVTVEAIERDSIDYDSGKPLPNPPRELRSCKYEDVLGSATVDARGHFSITFKPNDGCGLDEFPKFSIQLRYRLQYCGSDFCFSMRKDNDEVYALSHSDASHDRPLEVQRGELVRMPDGFFKTVQNGSQPELVSVAANYYASLVDTILTVHRDHGIPFLGTDFGEIKYVYPSDSEREGLRTDSATTKSAQSVVISSFEDGCDACTIPVWPDGKTPSHEYGHVMMLRAWGGAYGFDGIGKHADHKVEGRAADPAPQIAFKEAWAELVANVVFEQNNGVGCEYSGIEDNTTAPLLGTKETGIEYLINNKKALCDWFDTNIDGGDNFQQHGLRKMWEVMRGMHRDRSRYVQAFPRDGLSICDFVAHYQSVGPQNGSVSNPNSGIRPGQTWQGLLLDHNRISCPNVR